MVQWTGFGYAALAAAGHSGIDATRKLASQRMSSAELVALVGVLDASFLTAVVLGFHLLPGFNFVTWPLINILIASSSVKILAGLMYQKALQVSPLSVTVPYLAFVPALILLTSFFLLHEVPSLQGIAGVCIVTTGGYLLALGNSKSLTSAKIKGGGSVSPRADSKGRGSDGKGQPESIPFDSELGIGVGLRSTPFRSGIQPHMPSPHSQQPGGATWQGKGRLGLGLGIGLGKGVGVGTGSPQLTDKREAGDADSSRGAKLDAHHADSAKGDAADADDEALKGTWLGGFAARAHVLSVVAFIGSTWAAVKERLRLLGIEEGTLLMLACVVCLSLTNGFDKMGVHNSPSVLVFAWLQRIFMGVPPVAYLAFTSPGSFRHLFRNFPILSAVSFFEILAIVYYLKSIEWLLVSYAVAAKRLNILVSVLVGYFMFKENIWKRLPYIMIMLFGMILVVFAST